ncbi:hypothetical protein [Ensifer adhaerens]|uniref:HEPN domain-containing protein n=2 Tax=Ensifer TaxID=106591 RepID=A0A9Q8YE74_ENSAD|nr:hypothetical protein [Ensifer adhaerens]MDF8356521.1 hypothetical protein [Ensifer adhaerens]USJ27283.1 hypothetical protein NE863_32930 [Ensifer adhaerens]WFP95216.1 hypothetical protein P4B07_29650 [Ensifer adhaerens]
MNEAESAGLSVGSTGKFPTKVIKNFDQPWRTISMDPAYPGQEPSVCDTLALAAQYRDAAVKLGAISPKLAHLPVHLLALHSVELYLDALLLAKGLDHKTIRGFQHDLGEQSRVAIDAGLVLRKRTAAHLATLSSTREYDAVRYGPRQAFKLSQVNRVMATLDEVSQKVRRVLRPVP